jgi:hypothetical protein
MESEELGFTSVVSRLIQLDGKKIGFSDMTQRLETCLANAD